MGRSPEPATRVQWRRKLQLPDAGEWCAPLVQRGPPAWEARRHHQRDAQQMYLRNHRCSNTVAFEVSRVSSASAGQAVQLGVGAPPSVLLLPKPLCAEWQPSRLRLQLPLPPNHTGSSPRLQTAYPVSKGRGLTIPSSGKLVVVTQCQHARWRPPRRTCPPQRRDDGAGESHRGNRQGSHLAKLSKSLAY